MSPSANSPFLVRHLRRIDLVWILGLAAAAFVFGYVVQFLLATTLEFVDGPWVGFLEDPMDFYLFSSSIFALATSAALFVGVSNLGRRRNLSLRDIGLRPTKKRWYAIGVVAVLILVVGNGVAICLLGRYLPEIALYLRLVNLPLSASLIWAAIFCLLIQPLWILVQELIWRGYAFRWLSERLITGPAIVGSAALSALPSLMYLGYGGMVTLYLAVWYFVTGVCSALLFLASKSLWPAILAAVLIDLVIAVLCRFAL